MANNNVRTFELIIRASKNNSFAQVIDVDNVTRIENAIVKELPETATAQESALTTMADMLKQLPENSKVTIFTGENSRIRFLQIAKYLKAGTATKDMAKAIESKFTDTMRPLTVGEKNAIISLAEVIEAIHDSEMSVVVRNVRQLRHVQLMQFDGETQALENLVGKKIELVSATDAEGKRLAVVKGLEGLVYSENNQFGVGGNRQFEVQKWSKGYSIERCSDPYADKVYSELTKEEKDEYRGAALIRVLCDKELQEFLPKTQAQASTTVKSFADMLAA